MLVRVFLLLGIVVHKSVWEVLARRTPATASPPRPVSLLKRIVKLGKIFFLAFLIVQVVALDLFPIMESSTLIEVFGLALYTLGLTTAIHARVQLGNSWSNLEDHQVKPEQALVTKGIYGQIRHPIYAGDLLFLLGLELALNSWLFLIVIPLGWVVYRLSLEEEVELAEEFSDYQDYRRQTPKMFVPFVV